MACFLYSQDRLLKISALIECLRIKINRLISIESHPKKIVVGVVVVIGVVVVVAHVVLVVIPVDDPRNILKVWLNQVINRWDAVDVVVVVSVVAVVDVVVTVVVVDPRNLLLKLGGNQMRCCWC